MAREDWEHLFDCNPSHFFSQERCDVFAGMGLFDDGTEVQAKELFALLEISPQRFLDILNAPRTSSEHLITNREREFRDVPAGTEFFTREMIFDGFEVSIHKEDFKTWLDDNYSLLKAWGDAVLDAEVLEANLRRQELEEEIEAAHSEGRTEMEVVHAAKDAELEALKAENEKLRARVAELENTPQKATEDAKKGGIGSEAASTKRLAEWKEAYIPAMVKAAIELGAEGPKPERERKQRKDIGALLDQFAEPGKKLPSDCKAAVEVFRSSLPEGYVNTMGGAPKLKVTKIKQ